MMRLKHIKTLCILILAAAAIYQTGQLWFVNITNRNFFYTHVWSLFDPTASGGQSNIVSPYRIITHHGENQFSVLYSGLPQADSKNYGDALLSAILKSGEFIAVLPADPVQLYAEPAYMYQYTFAMPVDVFARGFAQRNNVLTARGLHQFTAIVMVPPSETDNRARVYFIDGQTVYVFALSATNKTEPAAKFAHTIPAIENALRYRMLTETGLPFAAHQFVPVWTPGQTQFHTVTLTNPYANAYGEKLLSYIQKRVEVFFDNPATVNAGLGAGGIFTYSDANTVVRYYDRDILEYVNYKPIDKSVPAHFVSDYTAAVNFINRDAYVVNEWYLADFKMENDQNIFYFDYVINNMPLVMPEGWPSGAEIGHPLEVTVERGNVVRYKKLVNNFHIDEHVSFTGRVTFEALLQRYNGIGTNLNKWLTEIEKIQFGYRIDNRSALSLYWLVESADPALRKTVDIR